MIKLLAMMLILVGLATGQTTRVIIIDSSGNQTFGTMSNGNVYFQDSNGHTTYGTIRDGNVFLTTEKGEITFGTVKDGTVFLTDQKGISTGTIRGGNIFLSNSNGSITTGTYSSSGAFTTTTSTSGDSSNQVIDSDARRQAQLDDDVARRTADFQDGYTVGQAIGKSIGSAIEMRRIASFCNKQGDAASWIYGDGSVVTCGSVNAGHPERVWPRSPSVFPTNRPDSNPVLDEKEMKGEIEDLRKQSYDSLESVRLSIAKLASSASSPNALVLLEDEKNSWSKMRDIYCGGFSGAIYTDLENQTRTCAK
jgi:hypothetical protein